MGTPLLIDGYRVLLLWTAMPGGRPWSTKFDYVQTLGNDAAPVEEVAESFQSQFSGAWVAGGADLANVFNVGTRLETVRVYRLTDPLQGAEVPGDPATDGATAPVAVAEVAVVTSLRTALLGRRYRGRQYWGGLGQSSVSSVTGTVSATARTSLVELVDAMRTVATDTWTLTHSVISGQGLTIDRPPGLATPVTQVLCDQFPDTQRRRGGR